eukprot:TRINITY_DN8948_c0_g4_i1.p1 TRINITY_DN8948_c0_g4~~TRINITY_DN8948_c0_g4_i1.p1  ORF type:complete len:535 (+),score=140.46 TRINITY_DN8948_c0_g4_i1:74-1678(+)
MTDKKKKTMGDTKGSEKEDGKGGSLSGVVKLVVRTFLEQNHYRQLQRILAEQWADAHSLTAVIKLMEAHGIKVSKEKEVRLQKLPEDKMIDALVGEIPSQSREQYEHFFLQLSFIASTTQRLRAALECGNAEVVEEALESAENVGVLTYLMRMSVAQAGAEVHQISKAHEKWLGDTERRMNPLMQAQALMMNTQKDLSEAEAQVGGYMAVAKDSACSIMESFIKGEEIASVATIMAAWDDMVKRAKRDDAIKMEWEGNLEASQKRFIDYNTQQMENVRNVLMRGAAESDQALLGQCFAALWGEVEEARYQREQQKLVEEAQAKMAAFSEAARKNAQAVMEKMMNESAGDLLVSVFTAWSESIASIKQERINEEQAAVAAAKMAEVMKAQSEGAQAMMKRMLQSNDTGLLVSVMQGWVEVFTAEKHSRKMEEAVAEQAAKFSMFQDRNKGAAMSATERAAELAKEELLIWVFCHWQRTSRIDKLIRLGREKNEKRKKDLIGVKGLFKSFANELESSLKQGTPRVEESPKRTRPAP